MHPPYEIDRFIAVLTNQYDNAQTESARQRIVADACRLWAIWQPVPQAATAISRWIKEHE